MHRLADLDGELVSVADGGLPAAGAAALIGKGVFTTVAVIDSAPFLFDKHLRRLESNARRVGIEFDAFSGLEDRLGSLIERNQVVNGRARITVFDDGPTAVWDAGAGKGAGSLIITADGRSREEALTLAVSRFRLNSDSPLTGIKSCNYLEQTIALESAREGGFDEIVRLNERDEIAGGAMSNIFWVNGGRLYTPSLRTGCLPGTTREYILENAACIETESLVVELYDAEAIYVTSAGLGIARVAGIDGRRLAENRHEIEGLWPV